MTKKKTVGAHAMERLQNVDTKQGIIDTQREIDKGYFDEMIKAADSRRGDWKDPFYIVVITKKERLMENVVRRYFFARQTIPTPDWDQAVWRFIPQQSGFEFMWVLPDRNTAMWMANSPTEVPIEQYGLLEFVMDFLNHKLYKRFVEKFGEKVPEASSPSNGNRVSQLIIP